MTLGQRSGEFLLVTQNVDDLHLRAGSPREKMVQIHGDIFISRCARCDFSRNDYEREQEKEDADLPHCPRCRALMRPGVVWFGEKLPLKEVQRVENYLHRGPCDFVIVAGTTAVFGYIIDWGLRATAGNGQLIEVNPEETPLSRFATRQVHEPATIALPRIVDEITNS
jgi:NAD-dependent deacetylase